MNIAILGATSQIAKDLLLGWFNSGITHNLTLFCRNPDIIDAWLTYRNLSDGYRSEDLSRFNSNCGSYDAIINFIGVGDPAKAKQVSTQLLDVTRYYDDMVLAYLDNNPRCCYLFLSSGAVYGDVFEQPVDENSRTTLPINNITPANFYTLSKLYAEIKHRARPELNIIDIRVFNIFSRTQNINARFFITDIVRAIKEKTVLNVNSDDMVRDFLHPTDFQKFIDCMLLSDGQNCAVDCYSKAAIDKWTLLDEMTKRYGLKWAITECNKAVNATGSKANYYSINKRAQSFGFEPCFDSLKSIFKEIDALIE